MGPSETTSPAKLKIAAAQYPLDAVVSIDDWRDKVARWVADGAATGANLLLFPEYAALELAATFGTDAASDLKKSLKNVAALAGMRTEFHVSLAQEHGIYIVAGSGPVQTDTGAYHNAAQLVTPDGLIGEQQKLMMTPFEREWGISPGQHVRVFKTPLATLAIAICYDIEFPLLGAAMVASGADLILVPSCTERVSGYHRVKTGAMARALEQTIVTVQSPTVGEAAWSPAIDINCGAAGIYVPAEHRISETGVIAEGKLNEAGWVVANVDLRQLKALRSGGEMRNRRDWQLQPGVAQSFTLEPVDLTNNIH